MFLLLLLLQEESLRSLHCLADKNVDFQIITNYSFEWLRDGKPLNWHESGDFQEGLWLPSNQFSGEDVKNGILYGVVLKVGRFQVKH